MSELQIVHLLDDFALGGVTRFLQLFKTEQLQQLANSEIWPMKAGLMVAPKLRADIIITHFSPSWKRMPLLISLRARNPHAKLVHVEHSYSPEWADLHVPNKARFHLMLKAAYGVFDEIVAVSHRQMNWLRIIGAKSEAHMRVIEPYAPIAGLKHVPLANFGGDEMLTIGAYGRFHESKGFDRLIAAFNLLPENANLRLRLGGFGDDEAALRAQAAGNDKIQFTGKVNDVPAFLGQCHIVAIPSRYETFGMVATEAREAGRPIIVSHVGGLAEQTGNAGLIVDCDDPAVLADALLNLRNEPLALMARQARQSTLRSREYRLAKWCGLIHSHYPAMISRQNRKINLVPTA